MDDPERERQGRDGTAGELTELRHRLAEAERLVLALQNRIDAASDRRLGQIIESAIDYAIIGMDLDGLVTYWNEGARRLLGWTELEMIGQPVTRFFTPEDRQKGIPQAEMQAALLRERGSDERWHVRKDGSRFWASGEMMPLKGEQDQPEGLIKILRDRTEQRLAAERHRADAEFLGRVLAASWDCIKVLDLDANVVFMNEGGLRLMEVDDFETIRGCPWPDFFDGPPRDDAINAVEAAKAGGVGQFQALGHTRAGTPKYWDVQVTQIPDADGAPERLLTVSRDITETRRSEIQVRELAASLERLVEERTRERDRIWRVSRDLLGVATESGIWTNVNPAWAATLGWSEPDIIGQSYEWLLHPDDIAPARDELVALSAGRPTAHFENRLRTRSGDYRWLSWSAVAVEGLLYCVGRDVTDEREKTEALRKTEEQLRQSQKMEAVGQLTGGLAHDFNNLLTAISGSLELLKLRLAQGRTDQAERYATVAEGAAHRAAALTQRLLAFSRQQALDPKPTEVNQLILDMAELIQRTVGPEIAFETKLADDLWTTLCDPNQLENAILNLAINARDAMPDGGRLIVETANLVMTEGREPMSDMRAGPYIVISVTDSGIGMARDVIARAFDPFFTTKPPGRGTGLGLSMIYGFAKQSGGQAMITSSVGVGTTVYLYLPRHLGADEQPQPADERALPVRAREGDTVLIVDDEPTVRTLITELVRELGYTVIEAADGGAGLALVRSDARIDLLITDVGLPGGVNGRQLAQIGRSTRTDLKVLFVTGYAEDAASGTGQLQPGMAVLAKPFTIDALTNRIKALMADN